MIMASGFHSKKGVCEGLGCEAVTDVIYIVEEKKQLCVECAIDTKRAKKNGKPTVKIFCEQHDKPLSVYCKTHDVSICKFCAALQHQGLCALQDVYEAVAEKKRQLLDLHTHSQGRAAMWQKYRERVRLCEDDTTKHLMSVQDKVDSVINNEIKKVKSRAKREAESIDKKADNEIRRINKETDEEIRRIKKEADDAIMRVNGKREKRVKQCTEEAEEQIKPMEEKRRELISDVNKMSSITRTKMVDLLNQTRDALQAIETIARGIEHLLQNDKELVHGAREVITSLTEGLGKTFEEGVVEHIIHTVRGVRFVEGVGNDKYNGKIDKYDEKWTIVDRIKIPEEVEFPRIAGCINNSKIIITNLNPHPFRFHIGHSYVSNLERKTTKKVISGVGYVRVFSCALLNDDTLVCGMHKFDWQGTNLDDAIRLYDSRWNLIMNISLPHDTKKKINSFVDVCVDNNGMIIAAERGQTNIHIVNPTDGGIVHTITCNVDIILSGALSSGDIVAYPSQQNDTGLFIIDRRGAMKEIALSGELVSCTIDPLTDDLYPVFWDKGNGLCVVNQLSREGDAKATSVLEYSPINSFTKDSPLILTSSKNFVLCDGRDFRIYKTVFHL